MEISIITILGNIIIILVYMLMFYTVVIKTIREALEVYPNFGIGVITSVEETDYITIVSYKKDGNAEETSEIPQRKEIIFEIDCNGEKFEVRAKLNLKSKYKIGDKELLLFSAASEICCVVKYELLKIASIIIPYSILVLTFLLQNIKS